MGTTLTGTTPQDTYDSLIKVEDNGPISGTAKYLSDGLGNNLPIAVSTSNVGIGTSTPLEKLHVSGNARFGSTALPFGSFGITTIATSSTTLGSTAELGLIITNGGSLSNYSQIGFGYSESTCAAVIAGLITSASGATTSNLVFATRAGTSGSTAPVERMRVTADGLTFNGDTAAANALDDYEEGTWTPSITFGGGSTGIVYSTAAGSYTKIGNQVSVNLYIELTNKGTSTGSAIVGGLPFAIGSGATRYGAISLWINNVSFANQVFGRHVINTTTLFLTETTEAGVTTALDNTNFANNSEIMVTATYFV